MVDRKDASVGDIDVSMTLGTGAPMGPLHLVRTFLCVNIYVDFNSF